MIDLHIHLGGAVPASVLWELLCDNGLQTEFDTFEDLEDYLTVDRLQVQSLDHFLSRYFHGTELIQSSPRTAAASIYHLVAKAYRRTHLKAVEIRYNPLKRLREGLHSMDAVVLASIQGLERASMHYRINTGILFSMGKELSLENNQAILQAAIEFGCRGPLKGAHGVVGLDMAGPESLKRDTDTSWLREIAALMHKGREKGLKITYHVGETDHSGPDGMEKVLEWIAPDRIGHGVALRKAQGAQRDRICRLLRERRVCLELCPSVNVVTGSLKDYAEMAEFIRFLYAEEIPFCINTDNPYLIQTNIKREYTLMSQALGADEYMVEEAKRHAQAHTFLKAIQIPEA